MADHWRVRQFSGDIDDWIEAAIDGLEDVVEQFVVEVQTDLVNRSPVDTGRFKANWQVTANEVPGYALNEYDKAGADTINMARRFASGMFRRGAAVRSIHFSNMLIYANALEYGHSMQAPQGVMSIVSLRLGQHMRTAIQKVRAQRGL